MDIENFVFEIEIVKGGCFLAGRGLMMDVEVSFFICPGNLDFSKFN